MDILTNKELNKLKAEYKKWSRYYLHCLCYDDLDTQRKVKEWCDDLEMKIKELENDKGY